MTVKRYADDDYEALCQFLIKLNEHDTSHIHWNWARLEWMIEHPEAENTPRSSIGLWAEGDRIVGAAIYDMYFGEAFCASLPGFEDLYPQILDYAWQELRDDKGLGISIYDGNLREIKAAEAMGFHPVEQDETIMTRELDDSLDGGGRLPEGFTLKEPDPVQDAYALQWLFWQGFDHGEDKEAFEQEDPVVPRLRKHFNKRLSLAAADPMGELAACCCLWYLEGTDYAYVEPVCTIPSCRRQGLARTLLQEAFARARAMGAKKAYVISDQEFYERIGFHRTHHFTYYWRTR